MFASFLLLAKLILMQEIIISQKSQDKNKWVFNVEVKDKDSSTSHLVALKRDSHRRIAPKHSPEELIWASFLFLLEREDKKSILSEFDLMDIEKYFPEYREKIVKYL